MSLAKGAVPFTSMYQPAIHYAGKCFHCG